jgi:hypothetical protein
MTYFNITALGEALNTPELVRGNNLILPVQSLSRLGSDALRQIKDLRVPVCSKPYLKGEILDDEFTVKLKRYNRQMS